MLKIHVIGATIDAPTLIAALYGEEATYPHGFEAGPETTPGDALAEFAGRACYQSWTRPNPATATNQGYLANILDHGHFSVLEHASVTVYIEGVSRSLTHELIRHRHFSYSQLSQRFVDESEVSFVVPPAVRDRYIRLGLDPAEVDRAYNDRPIFDMIREDYAMHVEDLERDGLSRKQAREAARAILPNCTETKIVVTANMRAWMEFFAKRDSESADAEIRELAQAAHALLKEYAPNTFQG